MPVTALGHQRRSPTLITGRAAFCCGRMLRVEELQAVIVTLIKPCMQGRGLSCRRAIKREVALVGGIQLVRVNGQDRGYQLRLLAVKDLNDIAAAATESISCTGIGPDSRYGPNELLKRNCRHWLRAKAQTALTDLQKRIGNLDAVPTWRSTLTIRSVPFSRR
jgi:hypothetical protein